MPPVLSDSESDADIIPSGTKRKGVVVSDKAGDEADDKAPEAVMADPEIQGQDEEEEEEEEEEEDGEEGEEEYVVEAIKDHKYEGDSLLLYVKWKGYEKKSDMTWEPEENCEGAKEVVKEYYTSIGGRPRKASPRPPASISKRGRQSTGTPSSARATKKSRASIAAKTEESPVPDEHEWKPPKGSWEKEVTAVDTVEKNDAGKLVCFISWHGGRKSQHEIETVYQKCPQMMLRFYEQHLVFKETSTGL